MKAGPGFISYVTVSGVVSAADFRKVQSAIAHVGGVYGEAGAGQITLIHRAWMPLAED